MSLPSGRGGQSARGGQTPSMQTYRPQNVRPAQLQPSSGQYSYDTQSTPPPTFPSLPNTNYIPPRPDYMCYPPPVAPPTQSTINQCIPRPTYPVRQSYPMPPCFPPVPPSTIGPSNPPPAGPPTAQSTYPYMVPPLMPPPPIMPPPLPHVGYQPVYTSSYPPQSFPPPPPPPQPVSNFNSYQPNSASFQGSSHYRHTSHSQYQAGKAQSDHRAPDRGKHYDAHRHREYSHSDRHRSEKHSDRRDRGRSPDRTRRPESSRRRSEYEYSRTASHGRTPPRHGSYERNRERHRHRDSQRSPSSDRSYRKRTRRDVLELHDWNLIGPPFDENNSTCPQFHFMPRFVRFLPDGGKEVLSMHQVLLYLLRSNKALVPEEEIANMLQWEELEWQKYAEECKGMIVTNPEMKPSSVRIDQLDREQFNPEVITFPIIVHFGIRPAQLSYAGDPQYQKLWKSYVKLRHLLANSPKVKQADKQKLVQREEALQKIRQKNTMRREVTVELSSQGFWKTGIRSDVCQHAMMLPVLTHHIRYHKCLMHLDRLIGYVFKERCLLQLAMTHPSHHLNFGMNPDHARNSLSNCGIRQPKYGDRKVHYMHMRKKGINTLINIMSRLGQDDPAPSRINHNERLEFLGDAVVEFLTSVHLYFLFPNLEEGGLATYRTAIVQNQHLAMLAKKLELDRFMLYAHGPDLCRESDLRHAMANCFEALMGAVYLEGGLEEAKQLFGRVLFSAFIAALYIDKDLEYVHTFMNVCFFPRLKEFILNQDWNDPKSQLQQCCLTLRTEGKEPDIPLYKTLQTVGPSHARTYTVAVYFKGERIGCGKGPR
ncbi:hypothetical protein GDO81_011835 [Engystomops pustulosus]|uniref:Uncharacterized protein n=1 Tax=Engystomops pustulosus TaxID=76066 RepID=A0AAV7BHH0_ENGPU|nr:hypothetical protein GDO81_011835 [Engystomops pustulosus]